MKNILYLIAMLPLSTLAQSNFTIQGKVADSKGIVDQLVYLQFKQNGKEVKDSAKLINGNYTFKGQILYPVKATIQLKVADSVEQYHKQTRLLKDYSHEFYIDRGEISAVSKEKLNKTQIVGSAADADRQQLKAAVAPYHKLSNKLYEEEGRKVYENKDSIAIAKYTKKSYAIQDQIDSVEKAFLFSHPQVAVAQQL